MRKFKDSYIIKNDGTGQLTEFIDIERFLVNVGQISWSVDDDLSKVKPGNLSVTLLDRTGELEDWLNTNIRSSVGVLPPFCYISLDGELVFRGLIPLNAISKNFKDNKVSVTLDCWSTMLYNIPLEGNEWLRKMPEIVGTRPDKPQFIGIPAPVGDGPRGVNTRGIFVDGPNTYGIKTGDYIKLIGSELGPKGKLYVETVTEVKDWNFRGHVSPVVTYITCTAFNWKLLAPTLDQFRTISATFELDNGTTLEQGFYKVTKAIVPDDKNPCYTVYLDTVDGLVPGDELVTKTTDSGTSVIITDVDGELSCVQTKDPVDSPLVKDQPLYLSDESKEVLVFESANRLIKNALKGYEVDFSRFEPKIFKDPRFNWLGLRGTDNQEAIRAPYDIQPTLGNDLEVKGIGSLSWVGDPDSAWRVSSGYRRNVIWTSQRKTSPASLMADESLDLAPQSRLRNRSYLLWQYRDQPNNLRSVIDVPEDPNQTPVWTPESGDICSTAIAHDYRTMKRYIFSYGTTEAEVSLWTGGTWSSQGTVTHSAGNVVSCVPWTEDESGSVLCLSDDGNLTLQFGNVTAYGSAPTSYGVLVNTRIGVYLFTQSGYGKVTKNGSGLSVNFREIYSSKDANKTGANLNILNNTITALDSGELFCFAGVQITDKDGKLIYETKCLRLDPNPTADKFPILFQETVCSGVPRIAIAFTHPTGEKINGILGGRLFQIGKKLVDTIERCSLIGCNAMEAVESLAFYQCAVAMPSASDASISIISRTNKQNPVMVNVQETGDDKQYLFSKNYYPNVIVRDDDKDVYGEAITGTGQTFSITEKNFVHSDSQAESMAKAYQDFFGKPRRFRECNWKMNIGDPSPWRTLQPLQKVVINNSYDTYYVMSIQDDMANNKASVKLLQALE